MNVIPDALRTHVFILIYDVICKYECFSIIRLMYNYHPCFLPCDMLPVSYRYADTQYTMRENSILIAYPSTKW